MDNFFFLQLMKTKTKKIETKIITKILIILVTKSENDFIFTGYMFEHLMKDQTVIYKFNGFNIVTKGIRVTVKHFKGK